MMKNILNSSVIVAISYKRSEIVKVQRMAEKKLQRVEC